MHHPPGVNVRMKSGLALVAVIICIMAGVIARKNGMISPRKPFIVAVWAVLTLLGILFLIGALTEAL